MRAFRSPNPCTGVKIGINHFRSVRLSYKLYFFSQQIIFFSHDKSANSIFNQSNKAVFSASRCTWRGEKTKIKSYIAYRQNQLGPQSETSRASPATTTYDDAMRQLAKTVRTHGSLYSSFIRPSQQDSLLYT
jgi:hypothetical protein